MLDGIISAKKTRLCFSADFTKTKELLKWIDIVGPHICILKTHIDILEDFEQSLIGKLIELKTKYNFLIFEDRKFSDIGKIFHKQLYGGIYRIADWADIITIHGICSYGILNYLKDKQNVPKILIVSEMSSEGNIIDKNYTRKCYEIALEHKKNVMGFICQHKFINNSEFKYVIPGVNIISDKKKDQIYNTPEQAFKNGADIIVVGSGIHSSKDPSETIKLYKI